MLEMAHNFIVGLPESRTRPFGKLNVQSIDTRLKPKHLLRNILIVLIVCYLLIKLVKGKGNKAKDISLLGRLWLAIKGVKTTK